MLEGKDKSQRVVTVEQTGRDIFSYSFIDENFLFLF